MKFCLICPKENAFHVLGFTNNKKLASQFLKGKSMYKETFVVNVKDSSSYFSVERDSSGKISKVNTLDEKEFSKYSNVQTQQLISFAEIRYVNPINLETFGSKNDKDAFVVLHPSEESLVALRKHSIASVCNLLESLDCIQIPNSYASLESLYCKKTTFCQIYPIDRTENSFDRLEDLLEHNDP